MSRRLAALGGVLALCGLVVLGIAWPHVSTNLRGGSDITGPAFDRTALVADLEESGFALGDRAHVRIFKREHVLQVWMQRDTDGRYALFRSYEICRYSGALGPKLAEGDRQAPEGFYRVTQAQLNPNSRHHLAFDIGFPNAYDRDLGRTGSFLMVHGGCTSAGCYAMTDGQVDEIYAVVEAALGAGQSEVDVSIFPFRMSETALLAEAGSDWSPFWRNLKQGFDLFERDGAPPPVAACNGTYVFGSDASAPGCKPITGWV